MIEAACNRICSYARAHKTETRILLALFAFSIFCSQVSNIEDFVTGFYNGFSAAGQ